MRGGICFALGWRKLLAAARSSLGFLRLFLERAKASFFSDEQSIGDGLFFLFNYASVVVDTPSLQRCSPLSQLLS